MKVTLGIIIVGIILVAILPFSIRVNAQTGPTVSLSPATNNATQMNQLINVNITISGVTDLWSWSVQITWDPTYLNMTGVPQEGDFLSQGGSVSTLFISPPPLQGYIKDGISDTILSTSDTSGSGVLAMLQFQAIKPVSETSITLSNITLESPNPNLNSGEGLSITPSSTTVTATVSLITQGPPTADAGQNQTVPQGTPVVLNGTNSVSTGQNPTYAWTFLDGTLQTLSGITATYTFNNPGNYSVTLIVTDSLGSGNDSVLITVTDTTPPVAVIYYQNAAVSQSINVGVGKSFTLDGSKSYDPENVTIISYSWRTSGQLIGSNSSLSYSYTNAGTYTITLIVKNAAELQNNVTATINVGQTSSQNNGNNSTGNSINNSSSGNSTDNSSSGNSNTSTSSGGGNTNQVSESLPPTIIGIIVVFTVFILFGSGFWLRKKSQ